MSAIPKALSEIKYRIPTVVLNETFKDDSYRAIPTSLDEKIMSKVIRPRVLVDCDLVSGIIATIPIDHITPMILDNYTSVYHIPKDFTQNKEIVSVLSVGYLPITGSYSSAALGYGNIDPIGFNAVNVNALRVADSVSSVPPVSSAVCELIASNTVVIRDMFKITSMYFIRCVLGNDPNMNNISPRSYLQFARLCELAVKSYIYNTLIVKIDTAYLVGGQELGAFKAYIESLADSEESYRTFLNENWRPTAFMNDVIGYDRFIKLQINGGI